MSAKYADKEEDAAWEGGTVKEVSQPASGFFSVTLDTGFGFGLDEKYAGRVRVGDHAETAGSWGYPFQGVRVNGAVLWFKDAAAMKEQARDWKTPQQALAKWDAGDSVWTIEMGGLGPGYEQAIQVLVWEMVRDGEPVPVAGADGMVNLRNWGEAAVKRCNETCGGFSGAQVGAAKVVAARFLRDGYTETLESVDHDRKIQVSTFWPRPPSRASLRGEGPP